MMKYKRDYSCEFIANICGVESCSQSHIDLRTTDSAAF